MQRIIAVRQPASQGIRLDDIIHVLTAPDDDDHSDCHAEIELQVGRLARLLADIGLRGSRCW
jgi:hypothetical protein